MVIYRLSRSTSGKNFQSLPILDPKILRVDVSRPPFPPSKRYILHSYHDTVVVTVTMHNQLRENKASSNRFHESFCSVVLQAAETYLNQTAVTNNLEKWQSLGTPGISPFTLQYSLLLKKMQSLYIFCRFTVSFKYFKSRKYCFVPMRQKLPVRQHKSSCIDNF